MDPSAKIAKGFESVTFVTEDGQVVSGTILQENDDRITLATPLAKTVEVPKEDIIQRSTNSLSAMPKITDVLTPWEVRDLVAYLASLQES